MKKLLIVLVLPLLLLAGCTTTTEESSEEQNNEENVVVQGEQNQEQEENSEETENNMEEEVVEEEIPEEIATILYENKALGYTISIPQNWYWRHYTKPEIKAAGGDENVDDYFIMGKDKLPALSEEYVGPIVIEKLALSMDEVKNQMQTYSSQEVELAGEKAMKYVGQKVENDFVAYVLETDNMIVRFVYESKSELHKKAFEIMIDSFSFVK